MVEWNTDHTVVENSRQQLFSEDELFCWVPGRMVKDA